MKTKIIFTFIGISCLYLAVIVKAFYIQVIDRDRLLKYSNKQFYKEIKSYPKRGHIFDRNGNPLAVNIKSYSLFTIPKKGRFNQWEIKRLAKVVKGISYKKLWAKLKKRKRYTWIRRKVTLTAKQLKEIKKLKTIFVDEEYKRLYPNNEVASQLLGFVGLDNKGLSGIEYQFDKTLRGKEQVVKFYKDAKGRPVKYVTKRPERNAKSIHLSIDKELQAVTEKHLAAGVTKHEADFGGAAVMDSYTGEVLAIANYPSFNPNKFSNYSSKSRRLSFITDSLEPGSTFKTFTIASALENEVVDDKTSFYCEKGRMKVLDRVIKEAESSEKFEWLTVSEILEKSSNIGTTKIAFELGMKRFMETLKSFGFGKKTNIGYPGEAKGIIKNKKFTKLDLSNMSFGQGITVSGLQLLRAYAAIANGGYLVKPTLEKREDEAEKERVLSKETTSKLSEFLRSVVHSGTGSNAKMNGFSIAGKTSTAQRVVKGQKYEGYVAGFIGYPISLNNRYVIYVYVSNPKKNGYYGNSVAAPIFKKITSHLLFKDKGHSFVAGKVEKNLNKHLDKINTKQSSLKYKVGQTPNLIGRDKQSVKSLAQKYNLNLKIKGFGIVIKQSPKPGTQLTKNAVIKLHFGVPKYE